MDKVDWWYFHALLGKDVPRPIVLGEYSPDLVHHALIMA